MAKTASDVINKNMIAKGYDNFSGLANLELIAVGGKVAEPYLSRVNDLGIRRGQRFVTGDGVARDGGFVTTQWKAPYLSFSQRRYLKTSLLGGAESGKVTIQTRLDDVPLDDTMPETYVIVNAILTLPPIPDGDEYLYGLRLFNYEFSRIDLNNILHEDTMKGTLSVTGASTAQNGVTTAAEKLTAFTTSGLNAGVTTSASDDSHTIVVATDYTMEAVISFTAEASVKWSFQFYVDAAAVGPLFITETNATPDAEFISMKWQQALTATDVVTVYVKSDEGGGKNITVTDGVFTVESI